MSGGSDRTITALPFCKVNIIRGMIDGLTVTDDELLGNAAVRSLVAVAGDDEPDGC